MARAIQGTGSCGELNLQMLAPALFNFLMWWRCATLTRTTAPLRPEGARGSAFVFDQPVPTSCAKRKCLNGLQSGLSGGPISFDSPGVLFRCDASRGDRSRYRG